jgi:predicted nuclease of predicted toxin-antitoxin system
VKLLFDENLSPKLVARLATEFPNSAHVDRIGLGGVDDALVWEYAKTKDYILVSKDADFHEKSLLLGHPPKVVWIRRGNCTVKQIEEILRKHFEDIIILQDTPELTYLMLH